MLKKKLLTPGEKIKIARKLAHATQDEIAGLEVTRNLISQIENNKTKLVKHTAEIIVKNLKKIEKEKNIKIDLPLTVEYFLEDENTQVNKVMDNVIKDLKILKINKKCDETFWVKLSQIEEYIKEHPIEHLKKFEIYDLIAEILYNSFHYEKSSLYTMKCNELATTTKMYSLILKCNLRLIRINCNTEKYKEALVLADYALYIVKEHNLKGIDEIKNIYFNKALALKKIKEIEKCLNLMEELKNKFELNENEKLQVQILTGLCYFEMNNYNEAESIYLETYNSAILLEDTLAIALTAENLAELNLAKKNVETAKYYAEVCLSIKNNTSIDNKTNILYHLVLIYIELKNSNLVEKYFIESIDCIDETQFSSTQYKLASKVLNYYISTKETRRIERFLNILEHKIFSNKCKNRNLTEIFFEASHYFYQVDKNRSYELLQKGMRVISFFREKQKTYSNGK